MKRAFLGVELAKTVEIPEPQGAAGVTEHCTNIIGMWGVVIVGVCI